MASISPLGCGTSFASVFPTVPIKNFIVVEGNFLMEIRNDEAADRVASINIEN